MNHKPRGLRSFASIRNSLTSQACIRPATRRGSAAMLITVMMFVFVVTAAITVDYAYMQLVRTELRAATDAAAKAGAEALSRTQDTCSAKDEAVRYAACNTVGGRALRLSSDDIIVGRVKMNGAGKWQFRENEEPYNAVKVNSTTGDAVTGVPLYFSRLFSEATFRPSYQATAGQQEVEVCLCIDRSGSMNFDMSGSDWTFPPGNPRLSTFTAWGPDWQNMLSPPHPVDSRWAALKRAIDVFLVESSSVNAQPRTAVVTWGSNYTMPIPPNTFYPSSTTDLTLPAKEGFSWERNMADIRAQMQFRNDSVIMGGTNLSSGLDRAVAVLNGPTNNRFANKVVILLTDGEWNAGRDPVLAAYDARAQGIIVHCISMLTSNQPTLQTVAATCGGKYYGTRNEEELRNAFIEIARSLPVVLTE